MTNKNRITISISDEILNRLETVYKKFGVTKSAQIQSLLAKHLAKEYEMTFDEREEERQ